MALERASATADILVVDDQADSLTALETVLGPLGHTVVKAGSGEEALKRLLERDFAVIVMDVRMPGLDGVETVELIKRRRRNEDVSVIFLTGAGDDGEQVTRGYSAGAIDYIVKPVDPDVLRSKVAVLLELQRKNAELRESEERFRTAFEDAPIGMGLSNLEGRWIEVNGALCDLVGRSPVQLLEQPLWELAHPADRQKERDTWRRLLRDQPRLDQSEKRFMRHDGRLVHALVNVSLTMDGRGEPMGFLWQLVDVTEQRRAEAERAARAEAEAVAVTIGKLQQVTEAALEHLEPAELMGLVVERMKQAFRADMARILLIEPKREESDPRRRETRAHSAEPSASGRARAGRLRPSELSLGAAAGFGFGAKTDTVPIGDVLSQVVGEGRPVILDGLQGGAGLDAMLAAAAPRALMASPLTVKGRMAGVVEIATRKERRFTPEEESLLVLMADRAGLAIEHARAYEREVGTVEMLQRSLLPDKLPILPGVRIAARYSPGGADVGGDWYDAIPLDDGRVGLAMGDVVGHGLGAASLMGQLRHAARAYALEGHTPPAVLDLLDRLVRSLPGAQMATLLYLVVDSNLRTVRFASAGHVPPLVVDPDGQPRFLEGAPNPPLGVFDSSGHEEITAKLEPGSTIVLYTDGLVEERGVSIDAGLEALRQAARNPGHPVELCDHLVDSMLSIHPAHDDIAVLALQALPVRVEPLHLEVSTDPTRLRDVRRHLAGWMRRSGASEEDVEITQMACHEACSNAIEHGYGFGEGSFTIDAHMHNGRVVLEVADQGSWIERPEGALPHRGRGIALMEGLMDAVELTHEGGGTTVRMERGVTRS
ncbi:MAG TPA: SpoIIE family protein phosphatase [Thermoleophilaceae bacterium]|nr:SpoIIE family protein phosphatase [Thermoleophilaceae bacterium]